MKWIFQLSFALLSLVGAPFGHAADELMSARIDAIQKASNGVHISFTVSGAPDFVNVEGSETVDGIYRVENGAEIITVSPGVKCAFVPVSTDDRFFHIRLLSGDVTNTLILPIEAQNSFGNGMFPGFARSPFQQIYSATEFSEAPVDIVEIHGVAFRLEETTSSLDTTAPRLVMQVGVFRGSMLDLPVYGLIPLEAAETVVDRENIDLTAPAGRPPSAFDVQILFDKPYRYNRTIGHLVMQVERTPPADYRLLDAVSVSRERGWLYSDDFPNSPRGGAGMIATKFLYTTTQP